MVSRYDVRVAVYNEIESVVSGTVPSDNVTTEMPDSPEDYPAITHQVSFEQLDYNRGSAAAVKETRDSSGHVQSETYTQPIRAVFTVTVSATDDATHEQVHETLKDHFNEYSTLSEAASDVHPDIDGIDVGDSTPVHAPERSEPVYAKEFDIIVDFQKFNVKNLNPITDFSVEVVHIDNA